MTPDARFVYIRLISDAHINIFINPLRRAMRIQNSQKNYKNVWKTITSMWPCTTSLFEWASYKQSIKYLQNLWGYSKISLLGRTDGQRSNNMIYKYCGLLKSEWKQLISSMMTEIKQNKEIVSPLTQ